MIGIFPQGIRSSLTCKKVLTESRHASKKKKRGEKREAHRICTSKSDVNTYDIRLNINT